MAVDNKLDDGYRYRDRDRRRDRSRDRYDRDRDRDRDICRRERNRDRDRYRYSRERRDDDDYIYSYRRRRGRSRDRDNRDRDVDDDDDYRRRRRRKKGRRDDKYDDTDRIRRDENNNNNNNEDENGGGEFEEVYKGRVMDTGTGCFLLHLDHEFKHVSQQIAITNANHFLLLPEELIIEILSWLPVESLLRFKYVSKSCNSLISTLLISNPSFIQLHFLRSPKLTHRLLLFPTTTHLTYYFLHTLSSSSPSFSSHLRLLPLDQQHYHVCGSCNGLVCFLSHSHSHFLLWNPATGLLSHKFPSFSLSHSPHRLFGFGYDTSTHTYKVVSLSKDFDSETHAQVYTFGGGAGGGSWRPIQPFPEYPFSIYFPSQGAFLSGTLNWVAIRNYVPSPYGSPVYAAIDNYVIVSLHLGTETYKQFSLPPFAPDEMPCRTEFHPEMEVFLDCLCLSYDYNFTHLIMWQMKDFGVEKSWTRFVKVSYLHLQYIHINRGVPRRMELVSISENGDVFILQQKQPNKYFGRKQENYYEIMLYNPRDNRVQFAPTPTICDQLYKISVKGYAQSLISPCLK